MSARSRTAGLGGAPILATVVAVVLLASCSTDLPDPPAGARRIRITTSDGERLAAVELGQGPRVAILSHGATGTKEDLYGLATALAEDGWRVIAYDARGVGSSTGVRGQDRPEDLRAVVEMARGAGAERLVLLGGSLGGSLSIAMAARLRADAVVALSPPADAFGALRAAPALRGRLPVLVAVAEDDAPFADDARRLAGALGVSPVVVSGAGHGTGMFREHPELIARIVSFADEALGG